MATPVLTKYFAASNDYQDLVFQFTTASAFGSAGRITIAFPSYYNPGLTSKNNGVYCTINGVYTMCTVGSNVSTASVVGLNTLALYGYSGSITAGASFVVRVGGIRAPVASYTLETFYVQINTDNTESLTTISSATSFNDTAYSAQTVVPLNVVWSTIGATTTRTVTTFTWTIGLNSTTNVSTTQAISAYFPESWGLAWGIFSPTCTVIDATNTSLIYASNQSIFGNLVQLNVSTAIPNAAVVILSCQNVRTTDNNGFYESNSDITIRVHDQNGSSVYQRSIPGMHNINYGTSFAATLAYLSWNVSGSITSPQALTAGTYGLNLLLSVTTGSRSNKTFSITPSNSMFSFLSSTAPFYLTTGTVSNSSILGCSSSVPVGVYALTFTISDNSTYTAPPRLWVSVNNNAQTITPSSTTLSAYYVSGSLSTTAPLYFDLSQLPPYSDITITPVPPTGNTNFTFSPSSIKLTPSSPKNFFTFTSTSSATVSSTSTASAAYTFTLSGTNAASYSIPSSVTVSLTSDSAGTGSTSTPVLAVGASTTDTGAATTKILSFTLTAVSQATIYWVVTLQGQAITDPNAIQTNAAALVAYNSSSANQAQYGSIYLVTSSNSPITINNLFPNTGYQISAVAISNTNKSSTVATYIFVTGSNGGIIQRWLWNYTTYPTASQRQSLLCTLTQTLSVPAINIRDVNGEICGNSTAFYNSTNSTGDLGIYFYPLQTNADTTMTAAALQTSLNGTNVLGGLNTTLSSGSSGIGWYNVFVDIATIKNAAPTITIPTSASSTTSSSIYIAATVTNDTGFLFVALCSNSSTAPTAIQMKQTAAGVSTITGLVSGVQVIYYYPGSNPTYNFTGLTASTSYNVYITASNNDPSFLQNFTSVTTIPVTTASTTGTTGSPIGVIFSVMAVFVSVISLMFF